MQQRGVPAKLVSIILAYADGRANRGGAVESIYLSKEEIMALVAQGQILPREAEAAARTVVLYSSQTQQIVSVLRGSNKKINRYRRPSRSIYH